MVTENAKAMKELALARKRYAEHARKKLGVVAVELFTQAEPEQADEG